VRKIITGLLALGVVVIGVGLWQCQAADEAAPPPASGATPPADAGAAPATPAAPAGGEAAAPAAPAAGGADMTPFDLVKATPNGQLKNPFADKIADVADEGHKRFMGTGCNGCHGGTGGGGMCPPLSNDAWNYDPTDDTLFRLITLGSNCKDYADCMEKEGFPRHARETVSFPMPAQGQRSLAQPDNPAPLTKVDDVWKIISWIRVINPNSLKPKAAPPPQ
jgi:mono/diheme cytochrome c family protein